VSIPVWLITGGCGFIGTRLIRAICEVNAGAAIRVVDNLSVGTLADLRGIAPAEVVAEETTLPPPRRGVVQLVCGDVVSRETMRRAAQGAQVLVHLAANTGVAPSVEDPHQDCTTNVIGTLNALEGARHAGVQRFVFASSGAPVGEALPPIHEEVVPHPVSPYGASKLAGEGYCSAYARTFGLQTVALRFGNVYGPGSNHKSSVVAKFIRDAATTGVLSVYGDGRQTRDFIYVDDLVQAVLAAAFRNGVGGEIFQVATHRETSVEELAMLLKEILPRFGISAPRVVHEQPRVGDVRRNFSDTTKARERLGWQATTTINDGIEKTIRWFLDTTRQSRAP
jgi:UDP-glucose 4-epimerase